MKELATLVDLSAVDFKPILRYIRETNRTTVNGVQWAQVYVTTDGRAIAIFRNGANIRARNAQKDVETIVEFFDESGAAVRAFTVNVDALAVRGGAVLEAARARFTFNRYYNANGVPVYLPRQRAVTISTATRSVY